MDLVLNAAIISRRPKIIATHTSAANNDRSYLSESQAIINNESPTTIDGPSFRPARLLISPLIDEKLFIKLRVIQPLCALANHQSLLCDRQ